FLFVSCQGQAVGIKPYPRRITERAPLLRLRPDIRWNRTRLYLPHPRLRDLALRHHHIESVKTRSSRTVEMHLAEDRRPVAGLLKLLGQGRLVRRKRSAEHGDAHRMRQLPGEK